MLWSVEAPADDLGSPAASEAAASITETVVQRLEDMPILSDREPELRINATTSRALGVTIPEAVRKRAKFVE